MNEPQINDPVDDASNIASESKIVKMLRYDVRVMRNALFFILERAPVTSFGCLLYTGYAGTSVYGSKISKIERACVSFAAPLSLATHIGFFKKCGFSLYECLHQQGYAKEFGMELLHSLDDNPGTAMTLATLASLALYCGSKFSDVKNLLRRPIDSSQ